MKKGLRDDFRWLGVQCLWHSWWAKKMGIRPVKPCTKGSHLERVEEVTEGDSLTEAHQASGCWNESGLYMYVTLTLLNMWNYDLCCGVLSSASSRGGSWSPSNTWFLGPTRVSFPNGISVISAIFAYIAARLPVLLSGTDSTQTLSLLLWGSGSPSNTWFFGCTWVSLQTASPSV